MLYLASRSPRRIELLSSLGIPFQVFGIDVVERRDAGESPLAYVERVAMDKARAALVQLGAVQAGAWALGADTEVVLDDDVFGKPTDRAHAADMLRRLSGREHRVVSAVALASRTRTLRAACLSQVRFGTLQPGHVEAYLDRGEWEGKAGGYAIQGTAAMFIEHLSGSYSGVMGLPLYETAQLLRQARFSIGGPDAAPTAETHCTVAPRSPATHAGQVSCGNSPG